MCRAQHFCRRFIDVESRFLTWTRYRGKFNYCVFNIWRQEAIIRRYNARGGGKRCRTITRIGKTRTSISPQTFKALFELSPRRESETKAQLYVGNLSVTRSFVPQTIIVCLCDLSLGLAEFRFRFSLSNCAALMPEKVSKSSDKSRWVFSDSWNRKSEEFKNMKVVSWAFLKAIKLSNCFYDVLRRHFISFLRFVSSNALSFLLLCSPIILPFLFVSRFSFVQLKFLETSRIELLSFCLCRTLGIMEHIKDHAKMLAVIWFLATGSIVVAPSKPALRGTWM